VDGPGTRLVVFLAGCPLRCLYCHNPDTWRRCAGTPTPAADLEALVDRYAPFVRRAGGGLTVSGGEPLMQPAAVRALFAHARARGVHTALDTSGYLGARADDALLACTDLVLLDLKAGTEQTCVRLTGRPLAPAVRFAERLAALGVPVWVRHVLVPGLTDVPAELERIAALAARLGNVARVDVLPFHTLGHEKYERLGIAFPLEGVRPPSARDVAAARAVFAAHGLPAY
jgi:pyruvate formate lyase activating enzyme